MVLALDVTVTYDQRLGRAREILDATKEGIAAVKVNQQLLLPFGLAGLNNIVGVCQKQELPLIADLKLNDIESTGLDVVESLMSYGFDAVIANPFVGREEGLGKVIERAHALEGGVIFLVYMSHRGAEEGYSLKLSGGEPMFQVFAKRARDWKADGVVVSAKSPEKIAETRKIVGRDCLILSPGVGAQGGRPERGLQGADFLIIGRSIVEAPYPEKALNEINKAMA